MINDLVKALAVTQNPLLALARSFLTAQGFDLRSEGVQAREWCRKQAEEGHLEAQVVLAELLSIGLFGEENEADALMWCERAADAGHPAALEILAGFVESGWGETPPNPASAVELTRAAAAKGYAPAMNSLAVMYLEGINLEKDRNLALRYLRGAARLGNAYAQCMLGVQLTKESELAKIQEGISWIKAAADQDYPPAHRHLGYFYMGGNHGFRKDKQKSSYHLDLAARLEEESYADLA